MWRRFQFFDKENINLTAEQQHSWVASASGRGPHGEPLLLFGSDDGTVQVLDPQLKQRSAFRAHDIRTTHLQHLTKHRNLLATLGQDDPVNPLASTCIKLWDFDKYKLDEEEAVPTCLRSVKVFAFKFPEVDVTSFLAAEEASSQLVVALGLANGQVYVIRGDVARDRVSRSRVAVPTGAAGAAPAGPPSAPQPSHVLTPAVSPAVTGLGFRFETQSGSLTLFAVTRQVTTAVDLNKPTNKAILDAHGGDGWCVTMTESQELVVGCPEAVYFYETEGRGACFAFDGEKRHLSCFRGYLLVISAASSRLGGASKTSQLSIYDLKNKLIAYSMPLGDVVHVLCDFGTVTVVQADGTVCILREKDTAAKMEMLFRKNLYSVAISLIQGQTGDRSGVSEVQRKFGDHLYSKGDFDGAMAQYLETIGSLEPSYVIRQFLDARRIHNLTTYLEALHHEGLGTADHTTLLLNCYTKLKAVSKLDEFIRRAEDETEDHYSRRFDVETAIRVCRAAGYHQHALQVAWSAGEHEWYLRLLLEDMQRYDDAVQYLAALGPAHAEKALQKYGKVLVEARPTATTDLLCSLCTAASSSRPEEFIHIFVERPRCLLRFLQHIVKGPPPPDQPALPAVIYNSLLELYLRRTLPTHHDPAGSRAGGGEEGTGGPQPGAPDPPPSDAEGGDDAAARLESALSLLQQMWPVGGAALYDVDHALVLCRMHTFTKGAIYLYERLRLYKEVLAAHMAEEDYPGLLEATTRLGHQQPDLWVDTLTYFGTRHRDCSREVREALLHIERGRLLPPLVVLQTLAANPGLTLSVVKDYIARHIAEETRLLEDDRNAIAKYAEETTVMRAEVRELRTAARIFQQSKCTACTAALDLPALHFLCMHSFHARCLGDNERECPKCAADNRTVLEIKRSLENSLSDHDKFFQQLENSDDGFAVVADYFGRGIFLPPKRSEE